MASKTTIFLILTLLLFLCSFSSGKFEDFKTKTNLGYSPHKESDLDEEFFTVSNFHYQDGFQMEMRNLLMVDRPDYEDPVANRKHEPPKPGPVKP